MDKCLFVRGDDEKSNMINAFITVKCETLEESDLADRITQPQGSGTGVAGDEWVDGDSKDAGKIESNDPQTTAEEKILEEKRADEKRAGQESPAGCKQKQSGFDPGQLRQSMLDDDMWTITDSFFASMFREWHNMPPTDKDELELIKSLESVIVPFERHINHSDVGFRNWRRRHKKALARGIVATPTWPRLCAVTDEGKALWDDVAWERRYGQLVYTRQSLVLQRLGKLPMCGHLSAKKHLFGSEAEQPPRQTIQARNRKSSNRGLGAQWFKPLEELLESQARRWRVDAEKLKLAFWAA
ncbi:hypothetical protein CDD82_1450 [Ophiocordyceps australis]|uniref:Uncharacterized protein n=1 Tax=Ophiocordyceps australis TaxID=1399860 RepID=A0A2C5YKD1_9HYPO|nr:hypothetical protein CDD82_1450 [Ophiocordyceps australis]